MRKTSFTFALLLLLGICWLARAQTQPVAMPQRVAGKVIRIEGSTIVVQPKSKTGPAAPVAIPTNELTRIFIDMELTPFSYLTVGMDLTAEDRGNDKDNRIYIFAFSPSTLGNVTRVEGNRIVLAVTQADESTKEVIVETDDATKIHTMWEGGAYWPDRGLIKVNELQPGMRLKAIPETGIARKIFVVTRSRPESATSQTSK